MKSSLISLGQLLFSILIYCTAIVYFGLALTPCIALVVKCWYFGLDMHFLPRYALLGFSIAGGYFLFGLSLILLAGLTRTVLALRLREGSYPIFSLGALQWAFVSSLYLLINFTFIDFILLTPFVNLLLRLLGAKIGRNVQINSKYIFDATLLEIGDNTVVGGNALIMGHVVERAILKLKKVRIGSNITIGSNAIIMPGCEIGDNAIIGVGAVLLKNTKVEPGTVYFGVPAGQVKSDHQREK